MNLPTPTEQQLRTALSKVLSNVNRWTDKTMPLVETALPRQPIKPIQEDDPLLLDAWHYIPDCDGEQCEGEDLIEIDEKLIYGSDPDDNI